VRAAEESYLIDKENSLTSIVNDIVLRLEPQDPGDPETLTNFIDWSVNKYEADHYFLIIWGHGSGIDDDAFSSQNGAKQEALEQDRNDRFYIPRHHALPATDSQLTEASLKSVAFVDSPISYLTNQALRKALEDAQKRLTPPKDEDAQKRLTPPKDKDKCPWRLDLLGMDACNMNLIELGYEVRKYADYLIASQDEIPDASWPYYNILSTLGFEGKDISAEVKELDPMLQALCKEGQYKGDHEEKDNTGDAASPHPTGFAAQHYVLKSVQKIAKKYTEAYQDYVDQPVALSALDLTKLREKSCDLTGAELPGTELRKLFGRFVELLRLHTTYREINDAIIFARRRVRSFYTRIPNTRDFHIRDIYIDLIHFCILLYSFLKDHPESKEFQHTIKFKEIIKEFICYFTKHRKIIAVNETTKGEDGCYGTSIYFPANPDDEFRSFYEELEFAQETHWGAFVAKFLDKNPDLFIPPKFEVRAGRVKGNPHDHFKPRNLVKGNPRIPEKGNPRVLDKLAQIMAAGTSPMNANYDPYNISPSINNVIYNYGEIIELGCDANVDDE
jgi:hypothetical protein